MPVRSNNPEFNLLLSVGVSIWVFVKQRRYIKQMLRTGVARPSLAPPVYRAKDPVRFRRLVIINVTFLVVFLAAMAGLAVQACREIYARNSGDRGTTTPSTLRAPKAVPK
jgi:hypothetical protein